MKKLMILSWLLLWPVLAVAESFPALYDVTGVAADDVLNIRSLPLASADKLGWLGPFQQRVEVVRLSDDGRWGEVNTAEASGWVHMGYMRRVPGQVDYALPDHLSCFGTEPFWLLDLVPADRARFERAGEPGLSAPMQFTARSENRYDRQAFQAGNETVLISGVIGFELCSDGMSERTYGFSLDLLVQDGVRLGVLSGCCSIE